MVFHSLAHIPSRAMKQAFEHDRDFFEALKATPEPDLSDAFTDGLRDSVIALAVYGQEPDQLTAEQRASLPFLHRMARAAGTFAGDAPVYLAGGLIGSASGTPIGTAAGAIGLREALHAACLDKIGKGEVKDFDDFMQRAWNTTTAGAGGALTGATMASGGMAGAAGAKLSGATGARAGALACAVNAELAAMQIPQSGETASSWSRGFSLGTRDVIEGLVGPFDILAGPMNSINGKLGGDPQYFQRFAPFLADSLGLAKPETPGETLQSAIRQGLVSLPLAWWGGSVMMTKQSAKAVAALAMDPEDETAQEKAMLGLAEVLSILSKVPVSQILSRARRGDKQYEDEDGATPLVYLIPEPKN